MKKNNIVKIIISIVFVAFLFCVFFMNSPFAEITELYDYVTSYNSDETQESIEEIETAYSDSMNIRDKLINMNGRMAKLLHMRGMFKDMGMYVTDDYYIVSASKYTSTDYEYEQTTALKNYLDEKGITLIYVNKPVKYLDDTMLTDNFGVESYSNRNADLLLSRLREAGVNTIDIRENITKDNMDIKDLFYRTDHHMTTKAGLYVTKIIAEGLNEYSGYSIDTSMFDLDNFRTKEWKECWLGEQGNKFALSYVGLDDFTEIKPDYETKYSFWNLDGDKWTGSFDTFVNEGFYDTTADVYEANSWHYSYANHNAINENVDYGKVLMLGDSYDCVIQPFLSLGIHETDFLLMRGLDDSFNLREFIDKNGYDTVIIGYAQFMIGAHDDPDSDNYRMFKFD